jgi:hypothetical protein
MSKFERTLPCTFTAQYLHADTNAWYKRLCESSVHNVQSKYLESTGWNFLKTWRFSYSSWICPHNKSSQCSGITNNNFWYSVYVLSIDTSKGNKMNANCVKEPWPEYENVEIEVNTVPPQYMTYMVNFMLQTLYSRVLKSLQAASEFAYKILQDLSALDSWVKVELSMCLKFH